MATTRNITNILISNIMIVTTTFVSHAETQASLPSDTINVVRPKIRDLLSKSHSYSAISQRKPIEFKHVNSSRLARAKILFVPPN